MVSQLLLHRMKDNFRRYFVDNVATSQVTQLYNVLVCTQQFSDKCKDRMQTRNQALICMLGMTKVILWPMLDDLSSADLVPKSTYYKVQNAQ